MEVIVTTMKANFRPYLSTGRSNNSGLWWCALNRNTPSVLPALRERLGDAKDQVREQAQHLIQTLLTDCVNSPQALLDKLLEPSLSHKNWRVKEQGLICLTRTLS